MPNAIIKAVVLDSRRFEMSDHFCLFGKEPGYGALGRVNHAMAFVYGHMPVDLKMEFYKDSVTRVSSAQIVYADFLGFGGFGECGDQVDVAVGAAREAGAVFEFAIRAEQLRLLRY